MSEVDKISEVAADAVAKILEQTKKQRDRQEELKSKSEEMKKMMKEEYEDKINDSINKNVIINEEEVESEKGQVVDKSISSNEEEKKEDDVLKQHENISNHEETNEENGLTKEDIEPLLNHEFKKIEALLDEKNIDSINMDDFRTKLQGLAKDFEKKVSPKRSPIKAIKQNMGKAKHGTKEFAMNKINTFINKMNAKIKNMSEEIDKKFNPKQIEKDDNKDVNKEKEVSEETKSNTLTYEQKIEQTLRNDPDLLKATLAATQINSMRNHLNDSKERLTQLNQINKDNPMEQYKINDMKQQLGSHINGIENKLNDLEQAHNPEQTIQKLKNKTSEHEQDNEQNKEQENTEKSTKSIEKEVEITR